MKATLAISLDTELIIELQRLSKKVGRPVSNIVEEACVEHLQKRHRPRGRAGRRATVKAQDQLEESDLCG